MATPITITPILKNEASAKFNRQLQEDIHRKVSQADKARIISIVDKVLSKSK